MSQASQPTKPLNKQHPLHGFTIVELLVVIVIIALLAVITIVAFNGFQQRARNAQRVSEASSVIKLLKAYRAQYDQFPTIGAGAVSCPADFPSDQCYLVVGGTPATNVVARDALALVGTPSTINTPPVAINATSSVLGPIYQYRPTATLNGITTPMVVITYWLQGTNQNCNAGAPIITGTVNTYNLSANNYSTGNTYGNTTCMAAVY